MARRLVKALVAGDALAKGLEATTPALSLGIKWATKKACEGSLGLWVDFDATMNCEQNCLDEIGPNSSIIVNRERATFTGRFITRSLVLDQ